MRPRRAQSIKPTTLVFFVPPPPKADNQVWVPVKAYPRETTF